MPNLIIAVLVPSIDALVNVTKPHNLHPKRYKFPNLDAQTLKHVEYTFVRLKNIKRVRISNPYSCLVLSQAQRPWTSTSTLQSLNVQV